MIHNRECHASAAILPQPLMPVTVLFSRHLSVSGGSVETLVPQVLLKKSEPIPAVI